MLIIECIGRDGKKYFEMKMLTRIGSSDLVKFVVNVNSKVVSKSSSMAWIGSMVVVSSLVSGGGISVDDDVLGSIGVVESSVVVVVVVDVVVDCSVPSFVSFVSPFEFESSFSCSFSCSFSLSSSSSSSFSTLGMVRSIRSLM